MFLPFNSELDMLSHLIFCSVRFPDDLDLEVLLYDCGEGALMSLQGWQAHQYSLENKGSLRDAPKMGIKTYKMQAYSYK